MRLRAASAAASPCSRDVASKAIAKTRARGNASRAISTRLAASSTWRTKMPMTLPPGRARLVTYPFDCGSKSTARNAIGLPLRGRDRGTQRELAADGEKHVDLARRELAIVLFVAYPGFGCNRR